MSTILDKIFAAKRERVAAAKNATDIPALVSHARSVRMSSEPHRFRSGLGRTDRTNIIAEFKKASPSKGAINGGADAAEVAKQYAKAGAKAISVLTEEDFFDGSLEDLRRIREAVSLPLLRKDFIFDEFQIYEAAAAGADAILLIVASLEVDRLEALRRLAEEELGMDALVEVHTREEMEIAARLKAQLIGVNNRNLHTFEVSLDASRELVNFAPAGATLISESGLRHYKELEQLRQIGYSGFLVGETLMRSPDPEGELRKLTRRTHGTNIKVCGITNLADALAAVGHGADALGFNFYEKSPRYIQPDSAREIIQELPPDIETVGVFVNNSVAEVAAVYEASGLSFVQLHGSETPDLVTDLKNIIGAKVIKAFRASDGFQAETALEYSCDGFLLDADCEAFGGSGKTFDWSIATAFKDFAPMFYLAGGLTAENVGEAIRMVRPYGVDVCSSVESGKGKKDIVKLERFIRNVRDTR